MALFPICFDLIIDVIGIHDFRCTPIGEVFILACWPKPFIGSPFKF